MQWLAVTAEQIGYWTDKLIFVAALAFVLGIGLLGLGKRRRQDAQRLEDLEADREADLHRSGPPRFNG